MESLLRSDDVRSSRTTETTKVPAEKVHKFLSNRWITPKFLEEFSKAVFLGVAWTPNSTPTMSVRVVPPTRLHYRLKKGHKF
jgi:hypothetical protein